MYYCITADQTISFRFSLRWFCFCGFIFMTMLGSKENSYIFFSSIKSHFILQNKLTLSFQLIQIMKKKGTEKCQKNLKTLDGNNLLSFLCFLCSMVFSNSGAYLRTWELYYKTNRDFGEASVHLREKFLNVHCVLNVRKLYLLHSTENAKNGIIYQALRYSLPLVWLMSELYFLLFFLICRPQYF